MKRATETLYSLAPSEMISIHALVKRATSLDVYAALVFSDFNPRPREEGDTFAFMF